MHSIFAYYHTFPSITTCPIIKSSPKSIRVANSKAKEAPGMAQKDLKASMGGELRSWDLP